MEALTLEKPIEKLLIHTNESEAARITNEIQARADLMNAAIDAGISTDKLREVVTSLAAIDEYIHTRQLAVNKELAKLHAAGIEATAKLPDDLVRLDFALKAIHNFPGARNADKFHRLIVKGKKFEVDAASLELYFEERGIKVYVEGDRLKEFKELENICAYLMKHEFPVSDLKASHFLQNRLEFFGRNQIRPRYSHFVN